MPRKNLSTFDLLKKMLSELDDDPTRPWNAYPCLIWPRSKRGTGYLSGKGYGCVTVNGTVRSAHRVSLELTSGPIPIGMQAMHLCDNPPCFRPSHLKAGSPFDNMRDCIEKGRAKKGNHKGVKNISAKLTESQVEDIRKMSHDGSTVKEIHRHFYFVHWSVIYAVIRRTTWKHV